ncbi:MAG: hypothetical protein J1F11_11885 [Oscillospiraceae bacterium]|nr:hypothetical protein [Oscillospiraceae bacterium]
MKKLRGVLFSLSEHIPAARWCLAMAVIAFTAVVSVYKYIDLADSAAFSSFETLFLIITDTVNVIFIYLPLYLFVVCGIMFDSGFGGLEILRLGSRRAWLAGKLVTYIVNTVIFFGAVFIINMAVCSRAFYFSDTWSSGFVGFRVMMGYSGLDFSMSPVPTIIMASVSVLLLYMLCGTVNMLVSILTGRESAALFFSLFAGIGLGLLNMSVTSNSGTSQLIRCVVLLAVSAAVYVFCVFTAYKKDLTGLKSA